MDADGTINNITESLSDLDRRVARVAHELKSPLSLIVGSLDALDEYATALVRYAVACAPRETQDAELARMRHDLKLDYVADHTPELLDICRQGTARLRHVLDDLRLWAGGRTLTTRHAVDLGTVLGAAVRVATFRSPLPMRVELDVGPRTLVSGDAAALERLFINLLANALRAVIDTPEPTLSVRARVVAGPVPDAGWVTVRVRDNGPGVPDAVRGRIFEPFFTTRGHDGLGLGLAICREIVTAHGGTVTLADTETRGAEFVVRLPIQLARDEAGAC